MKHYPNLGRFVNWIVFFIVLPSIILPGSWVPQRGMTCRPLPCVQNDSVKTITFPLRVDAATHARVRKEARRRRKSMADVFRDAIGIGLLNLPPMPDAGMDGLIADTWEKLGPAPEIDYGKL